MNDGGLVKVGALWDAKPDSKAFLTGKFGDASLIVMANPNKVTDKHPAYIVYIAAPMKRQDYKPKDKSGDFPF